MIHCIGLNPAIDQTVTLDRLEPGAVVRARSVRQDPGGKAVNVASVLADWGMAATAHGLLGQDNAAVFQALFAQKGITDRMIRVPGATRTNIKILEQDGRTTDVNLPGFDADAAALDRVRAGLDVAQAGELAVVSGSQPAALPPEATAALIAALTARGARVVMDVSGAPLRAALASDTLPFAIKPNRHELEELTGADLSDRADLVGAARDLLARGIGLVVVSLGTEGALFLTADDAVQARPVALSTGSAVGAGDAMVAGLTAALAEKLPLPDLARQATGFSGAKLQNPGPHLPSRDAVRDLAAQVALIPLADWITGA
ncbi:MAG: 1-phosphofructokinase family hexose kinase [Paracoccus sp. (in: a-proteobacteria)]|uniref:1-phosphofructokinase family hexose kinase n=1 Tax=Paracoccus sp. TaxID=267 RepID=UPI0026E047FD|nr:1-phosphofructokinase family hexose kinase [Paracoccus sp. (in: a-proteobacteria)]MDO5612683.1 1-phosphofructokinase family hexose kinase [Paracoccus sp. (in: a-proteobacteria)]